MRLFLATAFTLALPVMVSAAGDSSSPPAKPKCESGFVYDEKSKKCVTSTGHTLDTEALYQEVRALSYDGRYQDARELLAQMPPHDDRTLTYMGFTSRKMGDLDTAIAYYRRALAVNSGNILALSYRGQGLVEAGNMTAALADLREIRAQGGSGTWAEASLRTAIATGKTFNW